MSSLVRRMARRHFDMHGDYFHFGDERFPAKCACRTAAAGTNMPVVYGGFQPEADSEMRESGLRRGHKSLNQAFFPRCQVKQGEVRAIQRVTIDNVWHSGDPGVLSIV